MPTQTNLAVNNDILMASDFRVALTQLIEWDVHRTRNAAGSEFARGAHITSQCARRHPLIQLVPLHAVFPAAQVVINEAREVHRILG